MQKRSCSSMKGNNHTFLIWVEELKKLQKQCAKCIECQNKYMK